MTLTGQFELLDTRPIFIGGPDRCGKTSMRACLVSHPRISIPAVGSNMWTYFYNQYGDLARPENLERCLSALMQYKHVRCLDPDVDQLRREFAQGAPTYSRLFGLVHQQHAQREGKLRWGDQTGLIERYADVIFREFPQAQMIHMIRDPRDRYAASLELWPDGKGRAGGATARWLYSVRLGRRNLQRYPGRYLMVRFESLVSRPEETLLRVCDFLGETFVPEMVAMTGAPDFRLKRGHGRRLAPDESPLSPDRLGNYTKAVPLSELAFIQVHTRQEMTALDYAPDTLNFTFQERLRLVFADWPLNLGRMAAWRAAEAAQHRLPQLIGRRPSANMILDTQESSGRPVRATTSS